ncbi:MAG: hypothetical protein AAGA20_05940 [Planctomycetota bacterium]
MHTESRVEAEAGRFVVYLDVLMVDRNMQPTGIASKRINDYPTRRVADVAASWMRRAAIRGMRSVTKEPTGVSKAPRAQRG